MFLRLVTYLHSDCCFSELAL